MKKLIIITVSIIYLLFGIQLQLSAQNNRFSDTDIIGKWNLVKDKAANNKDFKYKSLKFFNDSKVEILIVDSDGERMIEGFWEKGSDENKKSQPSNFRFIYDIKITFDENENSRVINMLKFRKENKKSYLSGYQTEFQKE